MDPSTTELGVKLGKHSALGEALRAARGDVSIEALADELNVSRNTLGGYERAERVPEVDFLVAFAQKTGADLGQLIGLRLRAAGADEGAILTALTFTARNNPELWRQASLAAGLISEGGKVREDAASYGDGAFSDFVLLKRKGLLGSAGPGAENVVIEPKGAIAFRQDWLRAKGAAPNELIVADIIGDSMVPALFDGDVAVFRQQHEVDADDIYLFCLDGRLFVKRLSYRPGGAIEVIAENRERYAPFDLTEKEAVAQGFEVKGRFFWRGGDRFQ